MRVIFPTLSRKVVPVSDWMILFLAEPSRFLARKLFLAKVSVFLAKRDIVFSEIRSFYAIGKELSYF